MLAYGSMDNPISKNRLFVKKFFYCHLIFSIKALAAFMASLTTFNDLCIVKEASVITSYMEQMLHMLGVRQS